MEPNQSDPVIDEIREVRHRISECCGHDPARLVAYYMELQEQYQDRLIGTTGTRERKNPSAASALNETGSAAHFQRSKDPEKP